MGGTISDIVKVVDDAVKQIILQIDPSIIKFKNTTLTILDNIESRFHANSSQALSSLRQNLLVWLFLTLIFSILVLILIRYLIDILHKLKFGVLTRQYSTLLVLTIIIFWVFLSSIFGVFIVEDIDWSTLKIIVFSLLFVFIILLILIWFRFLLIYQRRIRKKLKIFFCQWNLLKEKNNRLQQSTMTLHMLALKTKTLNDHIDQILI
ncbi:unnamed protein product [Rotaria socialis]|uniref:Uncharacterized protein n=2 Tax=Rotaria TaxID=231623 RepID=A0A816YDY8_9BILA|nr:unnamed protein product [Rotaria magnacalcarata]CAF3042886.1 unnamed protein product [Rotaria socialis]CAF1552683.1 unnamed protein product [Rotaria magnacalcarata]CAF2027836.1 unnamed protein product [Rotaria magnacalcarata]CAF2157469.1 unnamed protein product [Rotaria magnacalcarata]